MIAGLPAGWCSRRRKQTGHALQPAGDGRRRWTGSSCRSQNNGYTVLQIRTIHTVDPIHALTSGYVYGKVPVVRVNIVVEAILFSTWNGRIMPADYCQMCGIRSAQATP